ncbi:MAG: hypothetical protein Q9168_001494 [Polycauliona sp. 1 TL-2023]
MKSIIVSAILGTAMLAIHGVSGAVFPINAVKRNEALEASFPAINAEIADVPSMHNVDKRGKQPKTIGMSMKMNIVANYQDLTVKCSLGHNQYHWAQTLDKPDNCRKILEGSEDPRLWDQCYVLVPCDVPNGVTIHEELHKALYPPRGRLAKRIGSADQPKDETPGTYHQPRTSTNSTIAEPASTNTTADKPDRPCTYKEKPFYSTNRSIVALCSAQLAKGSEAYRRKHGDIWDTGIMDVCFKEVECPGGLSFTGSEETPPCDG